MFFFFLDGIIVFTIGGECAADMQNACMVVGSQSRVSLGSRLGFIKP